MSDVLHAAQEFAARGWHVFPVPAGTKKSHKSAVHSGGRKWGATTDPVEIEQDWKRWPDANVGIACGPLSGLLVIEADTLAGHNVDGIANLNALIERHGQLPDTIEALSPSGSLHIYFKWPDGRNIRNSAGQVAPGVDVRGDGGMVLAPPSVKPGIDLPYRWKNPPGLFDLADCPKWLLDLCEKPVAKTSAGQQCSRTTSAWADKAMKDEIATIFAAPEGRRNPALNDAAFNLSQIVAGGGLDESFVRDRLTAAGIAVGLTPEETHATVNSGFTAGLKKPRVPKERDCVAARPFEEILSDAESLDPDDLDAIEVITTEAASLNPVRRDRIYRTIKDATGIPLGTLKDQMKGEAPPEPDQLQLARIALDGVGRENIICADVFVWRWDGCGVWKQQPERAVKQLVQGCLDGLEQVDVSAALVNAVTDVLQSEIFKPNHQFNRGNPETINCINGELQLNGLQWILRPHNRENYRTTQIPVAYDRDATAPMFEAFLEQVFRDDDDRTEKIRALLELMGYTLMSHARHERFVMLIGPGANGKSVLLAVLEALLGPPNVAGVQPSNFDRSFQRAHLHEKLANIVTELRQGEVIADAELKAITSGEPATVEHKYQPPFVMRPFATCWFGTNHLPHTRDFSEALFRRATILQFNRTFQPHEQDPTLKEKLQTELAGILNLATDAYAQALVKGFTQPRSSDAAKSEWRLEADQVAQFVEDACQSADEAEAAIGDVFSSYGLWVAQNGIRKSLTLKGLRQRLTRLGYGERRTGKHRLVTGLRLHANHPL